MNSKAELLKNHVGKKVFVVASAATGAISFTIGKSVAQDIISAVGIDFVEITNNKGAKIYYSTTHIYLINFG